MTMQSHLPSAKVAVGFLLASLAGVFILVFNQYILPNNPIGGELGAAIATACYAVGSYFTPPSRADVSNTAP